ncbi:MAG: CvpA family protein [Chloroflexota bacterium]
MSLPFAFWLFVIIFAVIGAMRGWSKELLVSFSVILSLAFSRLMERYVPVIDTMAADSPSLFWIRAIVLLTLVFFGYQTVYIPRFASKATRERLQDWLLGFVVGALNGYLIMGTLWFDMKEAGYPFAPNISAPTGEALDVVTRMMVYMPPNLLGEPGIYFAVIIAFIFVLVVFI